ncbi:hypothetical protein [Rhizobium sp. MHM7A]|uniref:hypothetical protein n=1 Tax=Rhizobium sp. MHM7A TaxID=2583233 RepID=UPI001105BB4C|nr:hypothetical protein [Rhizobium sp. MHM7A]TLX15983.1 hypothetical protein FFR93_01310 [Rhizobium sp. MHM7A]
MLYENIKAYISAAIEKGETLKLFHIDGGSHIQDDPVDPKIRSEGDYEDIVALVTELSQGRYKVKNIVFGVQASRWDEMLIKPRAID